MMKTTVLGEMGVKASSVALAGLCAACLSLAPQALTAGDLDGQGSSDNGFRNGPASRATGSIGYAGSGFRNGPASKIATRQGDSCSSSAQQPCHKQAAASGCKPSADSSTDSNAGQESKADSSDAPQAQAAPQGPQWSSTKGDGVWKTVKSYADKKAAAGTHDAESAESDYMAVLDLFKTICDNGL